MEDLSKIPWISFNLGSVETVKEVSKNWIFGEILCKIYKIQDFFEEKIISSQRIFILGLYIFESFALRFLQMKVEPTRPSL